MYIYIYMYMYIYMTASSRFAIGGKRTPANSCMWQGLVKRRMRGVKGARIRVSVWTLDTKAFQWCCPLLSGRPLRLMQTPTPDAANPYI